MIEILIGVLASCLVVSLGAIEVVRFKYTETDRNFIPKIKQPRSPQKSP